MFEVPFSDRDGSFYFTPFGFFFFLHSFLELKSTFNFSSTVLVLELVYGKK